MGSMLPLKSGQPCTPPALHDPPARHPSNTLQGTLVTPCKHPITCCHAQTTNALFPSSIDQNSTTNVNPQALLGQHADIAAATTYTLVLRIHDLLHTSGPCSRLALVQVRCTCHLCSACISLVLQEPSAPSITGANMGHTGHVQVSPEHCCPLCTAASKAHFVSTSLNAAAVAV